jgi:hypothetical protein
LFFSLFINSFEVGEVRAGQIVYPQTPTIKLIHSKNPANVTGFLHISSKERRFTLLHLPKRQM